MRYLVALLFAVTLAGQTPFQFPDPVDRLEATVTKNPTDTNATIDLLQRYSGLLNNPEMPVDQILEARRRHILWLIEHSPDSRALTIPAASIDPKGPPADPEGYAKAAELWRRQASKPDANTKTIASAVYFFRGTDRRLSFSMLDAALKSHPGDADLMRVRGALDAAVMVGATRVDNVGLVAGSDPVLRKSSEALNARQEIETSSNASLVAAASEFVFQNFGFLTREAFLDEDPLALAEKWAARARDLEPGNPGRTDFLITVLQRESDASLDPREKARYFEKALDSANTDPQRIRVLLVLANTEFEARNDAAAERAAHQLLDLAAANPKAGNHDDLIHTGHMVLGRVALAHGEKEEAKNQLLESARINGSPGLRNGGPKMLLAQDLLDAGEREAVLQYLDLCRAFWTNNQGKLDRFAQVVHSGGKDVMAAASSPPRPLKRTQLAQPVQLIPADRAALDLDSDKKISLGWMAVMGADSYVVEWDCRDAKGWQSERDGGFVRVIPTRDTSATLDFAGERQGRWRVYAVSSRTGAGKTSDWREFRLMGTGELPDHASAELDAGEVDAAERDARRLLQIVQENPKGWNHDDLAHAAHTLLGRIALRRGDLSAAREQLFASARIENAPGVSSLGPSMNLAQEILAAGDREAVLRYLESCRSFWKTDRGRLDRYVSLVRSESAPNLLLPYSSLGPTFTGGKAPAFKLKDLAGKMRTSDEFSGRTVVLDFWATWCVPCREELSALERLAREFRSQGLVVITVNVGEEEATVRSFASKNNLGLPVLLAGDDEMVLSYRVTTFPTVAVIDRTAQIVDYRTGELSEIELRRIFESAATQSRGN